MLRKDPENEYAPDTSIFVGDLPGKTVLRGSPAEQRGGVQANRRVVQDMISRSTAPINPQERTKINVLSGTDAEYMLGNAGPGLTVNGNYHPPKYGIRHVINVRDTAVHPEGPGRLGASPTLIHELGHRDSWINKNESAQYDTPSRQGVEEAYADDFAFKHTRGFGDRKLASVRDYPTGDRGAGFRDAYDASRTSPTKKVLAPPEFIPKEHVLGQFPMLERIPDNAPDKNTWDYSHETGIPARTKQGGVAQTLLSDPQFAPPVWR
jgi:hypothetical protein